MSRKGHKICKAVTTMSVPKKNALIDGFNREITYVRMSVTDRCDFRCVYCMAEKMQFIPRQQILTLEEIARIGQAFTNLGVTKIRLTGGEPLVRNNIMSLVHDLSSLDGLKELVLTTNGSQLSTYAKPLREAGIRRINISLDSLQADRFKALTRTGELSDVVKGIDAACQAGFERIKLNAVILKGRNDDEINELVAFACERGIDMAFIEEMPLGNIVEHDRAVSLCSSSEIRDIIAQKYRLEASAFSTGGPSRYYQVVGSPSKVAFISPHSNNFCSSCNRVRVTVEGRLLLCLGNEDSVDLRAVARRYPGEIKPLEDAISAAVLKKPKQHYFDNSDEPQLVRFMNMTGG